MKILHTADWHLGKVMYGKSMIDDQDYFINNVLFKIIEKELPDLILISGDIFDKKVAPVVAIRLFDKFITNINKKYNIPIAIIAGNHDSADRLSLCADILKDKDIYISSYIDNCYTPIVFDNNSSRVNLYLLPYFEPAAIKEKFNVDIRGFNEAYKEVLDVIKRDINTNDFNILVSHCFVAGSTISSDEEAVYIGGSGEVNSNVFEMFDYVALGHLHTSQKAGSNARYAGSPLAYSFDDKNFNKSITIIEVNGKDKNVRQVYINPLHEMKIIKGMFKDIIDRAKTDFCDDYIYVILEDNSPVYMPMEQIRVYYPNILCLSNSNISNNLNNKDSKEINMCKKEQNMESIFKKFLYDICLPQNIESDLTVFNELVKLAEED